MGCETVVPSSFSLSLLRCRSLSCLFCVVSIQSFHHFCRRNIASSYSTQKRPDLVPLFLAPFILRNLSFHCKKIVLYRILFQPHPICGIGKYQSASNGIRSGSQRKSFLLFFFSLFRSVLFHYRLFWRSHASSMVPISLSRYFGIDQRWNVDVRWRHAHSEGVFLLDRQRLIFRGRCLLNDMNWRTSITAVSSPERQCAPQ